MFNNIVNNGFQTAEAKPRPNGVSVQASQAEQAAATPKPALAQKASEAEAKPLFSPAEKQSETPDKAELESAVTKLNDHVQNIRRTLSFEIEESTGHTVISVYDSETEELIRQIPPQETLKLAEAIEKSTSPLLLREQA